MSEIIAFICFFIGLFGLIFLMIKKASVLSQYPPFSFKINFQILTLKTKIQKIFKRFSFRIFLQKILMKLRLLVLKIDYKIFHWLKNLQTKKEVQKEEKNYWEKIKQSLKKDISRRSSVEEQPPCKR